MRLFLASRKGFLLGLPLLLLLPVFSSLLASSSVHASSFADSYSNPINPIYAGLPGQSFGIDVSHDWRNIIEGTYTGSLSRYTSASYSCSSEMSDDLETAITSGGVMVREFGEKWGDLYTSGRLNTSDSGNLVYVTWQADRGTKNVTFTDGSSDGYGQASLNGGSGGTRAYNAWIYQSDSNQGTINVRCTDSFDNTILSTAQGADGASWGTSYGDFVRPFINYYPVTYPSGYNGTLIPTSPVDENVLYPKFGYTVDKTNLLSVQYLKNLDIQNPDVNNGYTFHYQLYKATDDYSQDGDAIDSKYPPTMGFPYQFQITDLGKYVLKIDLQSTPPAVNRADIKQIILKLNIDGKFFGGGTQDCANGICDPPTTDCDLYIGQVERVTCMLSHNANLGIINPSITAVKNLLTSLTVPDNPTCSIPLSDITISSGKVFPLSTYGSQVCTSSDTIRTAFPAISIATNFIMALSIFYLIGRMINKLTDNKQDNIVEGV